MPDTPAPPLGIGTDVGSVMTAKVQFQRYNALVGVCDPTGGSELNLSRDEVSRNLVRSSNDGFSPRNKE